MPQLGPEKMKIRLGGVPPDKYQYYQHSPSELTYSPIYLVCHIVNALPKSDQPFYRSSSLSKEGIALTSSHVVAL